MSDTHTRFVEAMRGLNEDTYANDTDNARPLMEAACDAFADMVCEAQIPKLQDKALREIAAKITRHDHAACRAALRKDVFNG